MYLGAVALVLVFLVVGLAQIVFSGINTYNGHLTCQAVAESFGMDYTDIRTLI